MVRMFKWSMFIVCWWITRSILLSIYESWAFGMDSTAMMPGPSGKYVVGLVLDLVLCGFCLLASFDHLTGLYFCFSGIFPLYIRAVFCTQTRVCPLRWAGQGGLGGFIICDTDCHYTCGRLKKFWKSSIFILIMFLYCSLSRVTCSIGWCWWLSSWLRWFDLFGFKCGWYVLPYASLIGLPPYTRISWKAEHHHALVYLHFAPCRWLMILGHLFSLPFYIPTWHYIAVIVLSKPIKQISWNK